jgi:hypothetical protein
MIARKPHHAIDLMREFFKLESASGLLLIGARRRGDAQASQKAMKPPTNA